MRTFYLIIAGLYCCFPATSQGIQFRNDITWKDALGLAGDSNKMLFVDVYTDWCGPCKQMDREVFALEKIGDQFNRAFINYKLNAENGDGPLLAAKYRVVSYPTYLFVRGDGTLIYKARSAMSPAQLLKEARYALQEFEEPVTILEMDSMYPAHKHDKAFLYNYLVRRTRLALENADLLDEYFDLLNEKEKGALKNLQLVVDNGSFLNKNLQIGVAFYALLENKDKFNQLKTNEYNHTLQTIIDVAKARTLTASIRNKNEKLLEEALKFNNDTDLFESDDVLRMQYYKGTGQNRQYLSLAERYINGRLMELSDTALDRMDEQEYNKIIPQVNISLATKTDMTEKQKKETRDSYKRTQTIQLTNTLYDICQYILTITDNKDTLQLALPWIRRAGYLAARDTGYFKYVYPLYLESYSVYLYQLGKMKRAVKTEARAIDLMTNLPNAKVPEQFTTRLSQMKKGKPLNLHH